MLTSPALYPVLLSSDESKAVHKALTSSGNHALANMLASKAQRSKTDFKFISAISLLEDSDFEMDDEPVVSASEEGAYVLVWRWISSDDAGVH